MRLAAFRTYAAAAIRAVETLRFVPELNQLPVMEGHSIPVERRGDDSTLTWEDLVGTPPTLNMVPLELAEQAYNKSINAVQRCWELVRLVIEARPSGSVAGFMERLASLYIWGFDSETYVLARSVLESVLKDRLPDHVVRRVLDYENDRRIDLRDRVEAARQQGLLSSGQAKTAEDIRRDGNAVIHEFPNAHLYHATPFELLRKLSALLERLLSPL
jgi:hypothetical protein